jgi:hypothetical protein
VGFDPRKFGELLAPHGTDKDQDPALIGEKGVGLTYTIFVANHYRIWTRSVTAEIVGHVDQAALWKDAKVETLPTFQVDGWDEKTTKPGDTFTEVELIDVEQVFEDTEDLFHQSPAVLAFLLRTRTAVGFVKGLFGLDAPDIRVQLSAVDLAGKKTDQVIKFAFMPPGELVGADYTVNFDEFKAKAALLDDKQKAKELAGRALLKTGKQVRAGRQIGYYAFFAPSRNLWKEVSAKNAIVGGKTGTDPLYTGGIFVATRGMPTGVELDQPVTGFAGYWPNFFMLLEDDAITFDLGRKSVPGRTKGMLRDLAKELFEEMLPFAEYATKDPPIVVNPTIQQFEKTQAFDDLKKLSDLGLKAISYQKHPDGQEAAVVALFHELVGAGLLQGYFTLRTGYKETYDLWGTYRVAATLVGKRFRSTAKDGFVDLPFVGEFKFAAQDILRDFDVRRKFFTMIDLIICWDVDAKVLKTSNVSLEQLSADEVLFHGSNYKLVWPGAYNLGAASEKPVLALRQFVEGVVKAGAVSSPR